MARICALLANVNRDVKRHPKPYTEADFLFDFAPRPEQTAEQKLAVIRHINAVLGGTEGHA